MCSAESQAAENFCRRTDGQKDGPTIGPLVGRHTLFKNLKKTPLRRAMHGFRSHRFLFPFLPCFSSPCVLARAARRAALCAIEVKQLRWPCLLAWLGWRQAGVFQRAESTEFTKLTHRRRRNCINISSQYNTAWTYKVCYETYVY